MNRAFDRSIYFDIATFDNLRNKGFQIKELFSFILDNMINKFEYPLIIDIQKLNNQRTVYQFNEKSWGNACKMLINGQIQHMMIANDTDHTNQVNFYNPAIALSITCDYQHEFRGSRITNMYANSIAFSLSERLFNSALVPMDIQKQFVSCFKKSLTALNGVSGYITLEKIAAKMIPQESSMESILRLFWSVHSKNFDKVARGYFWGSIISEGHIDRLGGIDAITKDAPCIVKEIIEHNGRKALYLQLTSDINNYTNNELSKLKRYIYPILPEEDIEIVRKTDPNSNYKEWTRLIFD